VKKRHCRPEKGCTCPRDFPVCTCGFVQTMEELSRKPILPSVRELAENPRSRSAKLRVARRI
jgi:16S rRNA (cytosine1402-N4)-methyltransferase